MTHLLKIRGMDNREIGKLLRVDMESEYSKAGSAVFNIIRVSGRRTDVTRSLCMGHCDSCGEIEIKRVNDKMMLAELL